MPNQTLTMAWPTRPGITAMIEAVEGLVREGEIGAACQIIPAPGSPDDRD